LWGRAGEEGRGRERGEKEGGREGVKEEQYWIQSHTLVCQDPLLNTVDKNKGIDAWD
jgi:hypothetical protein